MLDSEMEKMEIYTVNSDSPLIYINYHKFFPERSYKHELRPTYELSREEYNDLVIQTDLFLLRLSKWIATTILQEVNKEVNNEINK